MKKVLLISESTLKKYTLINDNVDGVYLLTAIQTAQELDLETIIGTSLVNKLCSLVSSGDINNDEYSNYKNLLDEYITPYLCWDVMQSVQIGLNYKFTNSGMVGQDDEHKNRLDYKNAQTLQQQYQNYANSYGNKMKNYLCHNSYLFPEYNQCVNGEHNEDINGCGIFLADIPYNNFRNYIGK